MDAIINGIKTLLSNIVLLVESVFAFFKWLPTVFAFTSVEGPITFIPAALQGAVAIVVVVYIIKIVLGADNG